ncbi:hypothetical protein Hanom_Chr02g00157691 [Helianthus anomalus]
MPCSWLPEHEPVLYLLQRPSQFTMNSFFILSMASCSPRFALIHNMLSTLGNKLKHAFYVGFSIKY